MLEVFKINNLLVFFDNKPDRASCRVDCTYSHGGSWYEKKSDHGRRHLLEHCLVARTKELNDVEFKEFCYKNSLNFNAYTSPSVIQLNGKSHKSDAYMLVELFLELFLTPTFDPRVLEKEREIVLREISERQGDTEYTLMKDMSTQFFTEGSYERHEVLGEYADVASTQMDDITRLYSDLINESVCIIMISGGGITRAQIETLAASFGVVAKESTLSPHIYPNALKTIGWHSFYHNLAHQEGSLTLLIPVPVVFENRPTRSLYSDIYFSWNGSGLYDYLRDELGLVYGFSNSYEQQGDFLRLDLTVELERTNAVMKGIHDYLVKQQEEFDDEKFAIAKSSTIKKFDQARDSLGFDANFQIDTLLFYGEEQSSQSYVDSMQAVNKSQIQEFHNLVLANWQNATTILSSRQEKVQEISYEFTNNK